MTRRTRLLPVVTAVVALLMIPAGTASADPPPGPYFNGFEQNTAGWFNFSGGTIHREPSGYIGSGYASGIASATGNWHARLGKDPSPDTCASGGGPQPIYRGPFTNWGGYSSIFPTGGYSTRVDIYLDTAWASTHFDQRFDWSSAINNTMGQHRRDFVFNAGTEPGGFVISASNNGDRCGAFPANPGRMPIHIVASGWYTFEHNFTGVPGGPLIVNLRVINKATNATVGTWVLSDPTDVIGVTVGGNRYGWFVQNEIDDLAIDNSERTGLVSTPGCEIKINNGGSITTVVGDHATFGGNAKVSLSGEASGQQTYQDHGPMQPLMFKALTVEAVICNDDRDEAEIHGTGTVDGEGEHQYRIKLRDDDEPGTGDMYGIIIPTAGYASGDQMLDGGNVQIR
jgi:hypothetical protein